MRDVNDFYTPRRAIIVDATALICMAIAAVASSTFVWDTLASGFRTGRLERAFLIFLAVVLGAGALGGTLGLSLGKALANRWEKRHRGRRPTVYSDEHAEPTGHPAEQATRPEVPDVGLHVRDASPAELETFAREVALSGVAPRMHSLVCYLDGGVAGILDMAGDRDAAVILRLQVAPHSRRRGVGRALVSEARRHATRVTLADVPSDPAAEAFLRAVGARKREGWTL